MKKVVIVHTSFVSVEDLKERFARLIPEVSVNHIVDDSLLAEVSKNGAITPGITERMVTYFREAKSVGADLIFNQCSSVGLAAEIAAKTVDVPVLRVDEAMAEKAVSLGARIAVIATVSSTVHPSCQIIKDTAAIIQKEVLVTSYLVDGALATLMSGDRETHNRLVKEAILKAQQVNDVIVLAQGSMVGMLPLLTDIVVPVLSSPELGVLKARERLGFK